MDVSKIAKLVKSINVLMDNVYADHDTLQDIERRLKDLTVEYNILIE